LFSQFTLRSFDKWNRKLHIYLGLYLLWFLWLFSISGLLLNHPKWRFADFWPDRRQSGFEKTIRTPQETGDLNIAGSLMRQLGISGEIEWTTTRPASDRFEFRIVRPGRIIEVKTDLKKGQASIQETQTNGWGVVKMLHTLTGVRVGDSSAERDWWATKVWSLSMDAVVLGLVFLALSSLYMWLRLKKGRTLGAMILGLGILGCGFFVLGLA
jgi:hypothetical protein